MQPNQQNPYDFITNAPQKKRGLSFGGGNTQKDRMLQVAIVGGIILLIAIVLMMVLSSAGKGKVDDVYKLAAAQQDIIDIATTGKTNVRSAQLATQIATVNAVMASQNNQTLVYIGKLGINKPAKNIGLYQVTTYKKSLDDAKNNGNYDDAYSALLANRIDDYRGKLQAAYASSKNQSFRKQLANYDQEMILLSPPAKTN